MALGETIDLNRLIQEVKDFFAKPNPSSSTTSPIASKTSPNNLPELANTYQSPIKGSWNNSGGFDPTSIRPNGRKGHLGVDMRAPGGTPVYPMAPGVVTSAGTDPLGGNVVNIQHANGVRTYYAHLSSVKVQKGQKVDADTVIGNVGDSGNAKGTFPHLHFQVWNNNSIQNPASYFSVPNYTPVSKEELAHKWLSNEQINQEASHYNSDQLLKLAEEFYSSCVQLNN